MTEIEYLELLEEWTIIYAMTRSTGEWETQRAGMRQLWANAWKRRSN